MMHCNECFYADKSGYDDWLCRRMSPGYETVESWRDLRRHVPVFPVMKGIDWCGEFRPRDNLVTESETDKDDA